MRESKGAEDENLVKLKKHYILPAKIANKKLAKKKKNYSARTRVANLIFWRQLLVTNITCIIAEHTSRNQKDNTLTTLQASVIL